MSFQKNVSAVVRSAISFQREEGRALNKKWARDSKTYLDTFYTIEAMHADGVSLEDIRKALMADFRVVMADNPDIESDIKANRAIYKPLFEGGYFGTGFDWEAYVAGFDSQDAWRKHHRKSSGARPDDGSKGKKAKPATDADRVAAMLATLSGCDDIPGAVAAFIEGASQLIEG
jgi:hypothetical protein